MSVAYARRACAPTMEYVTFSQARKRWPKLQVAVLYRLALIGDLGYRLTPGRAPVYRLDDLENIFGSPAAAV